MKKAPSSMLTKLTKALESILFDKNTSIICDSDGMSHIGFDPKVSSKVDLLQSLYEMYGRSDIRQKVSPDLFSLDVSNSAVNNNIGLYSELFADYVDQNSELMHVSSIIQGEQGFFEISPVDFIKSYAVHAAVFLSPSDIAKLLIEWTNRNRVDYTKKFHLRGIEVESPLTLNFESFFDFTINPPDEENFDIMLNEWTESGLESGVGAIVTIRKTEPMFCKSERSNDIDYVDEVERERDTDFIDKVCKCLSLVLKSYVSLNCSWIHDWNILPFHMKARLDRTSGRLSEHTPSILKQEHLDKALEILPNFNKLSANKRFRISVSRGLKSMHTLTEYEDKIINMRIAMESLLLKGNESGIKEKLAIISAKFLEADLPGRRKIRNLVENFYKDSSSIIHGNKNAEDVRIDIKKIQNLWNRLIIKILEVGKIPNWDNIVLE